MTFHTQLKVRFGDEDHARIVYFPRFFHFFHVAFEDFFEAEIHPYRESLDHQIGWPAVHAEADFLSPLRFGDVVDFEVTVERVGKSSATFLYVGRIAKDDALSAPVVNGRIVVACIEMTSMRGQPIPDRYREVFTRHLVAPPT
jgi:4-hydroxybenzoyl-CoA thioesterase